MKNKKSSMGTSGQQTLPKKKPAKSQLIAEQELCGLRIKVVAEPDAPGGWFFVTDADYDGAPAVHVGLVTDTGAWHDVFDTLLHEVLEVTLALMDLRFTPSYYVGVPYSLFVFHFTHPQYQEAMSRVARVVCAVEPALRKCWNEARRNADAG